MQLKQYQTDTLDTLRRFFEQARLAGPKAAYEAIATEPEQAARIGRYAGTYAPVAARFSKNLCWISPYLG